MVYFNQLNTNYEKIIFLNMEEGLQVILRITADAEMGQILMKEIIYNSA